jgi:predicted secreted hydrolase
VRQTEGQPYRAGTWIGADGRTEALHGEQIQLSPLTITDLDRSRKVPTRWRVQVAARGIDIEVEAVQPQAWMGTTPPYWEGPVRLRGSTGGRGYLEMTGY